jgi:undecaprenyl-diphosphatase
MDEATAGDYEGIVFDVPDRPDLVRSPADILHLVLAGIIVTLSIVVVLLFSTTMQDPGGSIVSATDTIPGPIDDVIVLAIAAISVGIPLLLVGWVAVRQRPVVIVMVGVAAVLAAASTGLAYWWVLDVETSGAVEQITTPFYILVAVIVAVLTVTNSFMSHRERNIAWMSLWFGIVVRLAIVAGLPVVLAIALGLGWAAGSIIRFAFGTPNPSPTGEQIVDALRAVGFEPVRVKAAGVDARGSKPYFVDLDDGERLFVKTLSKDERSADLLFRGFRAVFLKNIGDEPAFSSLRRAVEHEALAAMVAASIGVNTPAIRATRKMGDEDYAMLLAQDAIDGRSLDGVPDDQMTDDVLVSVWEQVGKMHGQYLAHRDLRLANVFLDRHGDVWMIDFGFSEISADQVLLDTDVAELVMSTTLRVGATRAVDVAARIMGTDALRRASRRMQPMTLSGATRAGLKDADGLYDEVLDQVRVVCGMDKIEFDKVSRLLPSQSR